MADKIIQPKVKNSFGTYDNLIVQQAINAENSNNDGLGNNINETYTKFSNFNQNTATTIGTYTFPKRLLLWSGSSRVSGTDINISNLPRSLADNDSLEIEYKVTNPYPGGLTYNIVAKFKATLGQVSGMHGSGVAVRVRPFGTDYSFFNDVAPYVTCNQNSIVIKGDRLFVKGGEEVEWHGGGDWDNVLTITKLTLIIE